MFSMPGMAKLEFEHFLKFIQGQSLHSRYRWLKENQPTGMFPYYHHDSYRGITRMPNARLTALLSRYQARVLFRRIRESTQYSKLKWSLAYQLSPCSKPFLYNRVELFKRFGLSYQDDVWMTFREEESRDPAQSKNGFNSGFGTIDELIFSLVLHDLVGAKSAWAKSLKVSSYLEKSDDPRLKDYEKYFFDSSYRDFVQVLNSIVPKYETERFLSLCGVLRAESEREAKLGQP
jgi:hypothetical protein